MASTFRGVIEFMNKIGLYDVVLPFLLVFVVVFGVLEKSKIFGTVKIDDVETTKKNLNAIVAFVVAFFVVASVRLVDIITQVSANTVTIMLFTFFFLILVGMLVQGEKGIELEGGWKIFFYIIILIALILIFIGALGWLPKIGEYISQFWENEIVASVVLLIIVVGFMFAIVGGSPKKSKSD
ncbi:hypothetical protein DRJ48_02830 [Candidatus Woesearchaeota archaeon]|nr:MAG: hypothetical protein DRJ48_02830 [Candidatus Woesearchaeota archaeon]